MNIKTWLGSFKKYDVEIEEIRDELVYFEKHRTSCVEDRICELKERLEQLMEKKIILTRVVDNISDPIPRAIFRFRYVMGDPWKAVAAKCGKMSERYAHYIHDDYLPEVEMIFNEEMKGADHERRTD